MITKAKVTSAAEKAAKKIRATLPPKTSDDDIKRAALDMKTFQDNVKKALAF